jgi:hypothetical protein
MRDTPVLAPFVWAPARNPELRAAGNTDSAKAKHDAPTVKQDTGERNMPRGRSNKEAYESYKHSVRSAQNDDERLKGKLPVPPGVSYHRSTVGGASRKPAG